jgi:hypothetical protein
MRPMFTVMGGEFKTVTNDTNSYPGKILIVRHQFMHKREELVFYVHLAFGELRALVEHIG